MKFDILTFFQNHVFKVHVLESQISGKKLRNDSSLSYLRDVSENFDFISVALP